MDSEMRNTEREEGDGGGGKGGQQDRRLWLEGHATKSQLVDLVLALEGELVEAQAYEGGLSDEIDQLQKEKDETGQ